MTSPPGVAPHGDGLQRSVSLFRLYLHEPSDPEPFYRFLADDTFEQLDRFAGRIDGPLLDIGGAAGYLARAADGHGYDCVVVEPFYDQLFLHEQQPTPLTALADGRALPVPDGSFGVVHCSNVLEHIPDYVRLLEEMVRVLRPGGVGYLAFTPWTSPWGGHETSPWHYFGGEYAARRYERRHGTPPKNRFGESLFALRSAEVRTELDRDTRIEICWSGPRYWPSSWWPLARVPLVGDLLSWNHLVIFRKRASA